MPAKPVFNEEQQEAIHAAALRVWKKFKADKKTQEDMALAIGLSQQSVSAILKGTYSPGVRPAAAIANLDGKRLEQLVGAFVDPAAESPGVATTHGPMGFANLDVCIQFHAATKHWSPWTVAAARAGFFGPNDFPAPQWVAKLDHLEKALERARKAAA